MDKIYLDNAAFYRPVFWNDKEINEKIIPNMANNQSITLYGSEMAMIVKEARKKVASAINAKPEEIFFTRNATEANDMMTFLYFLRYGYMPTVSAFEHPSLLYKAEATRLIGSEFHMYVNNETGVIFDFDSCCVGSDITCAIGNIDIDIKKLGLSYATFDSIKFGGIGCGVLYIDMDKISEEERKYLAFNRGTENILNVYITGEAIEDVCNKIECKTTHCTNLKNHFLSRLEEEKIDFVCNSKYGCIPSIVSISIKDIDGVGLVSYLDSNDIIVSSGSACHSGNYEPSRILKFIGVKDEYINGTIRVSTNIHNTIEEIDKLVDCIKEYIDFMKKYD